jgi:hypothetical protein
LSSFTFHVSSRHWTRYRRGRGTLCRWMPPYFSSTCTRGICFLHATLIVGITSRHNFATNPQKRSFFGYTIYYIYILKYMKRKTLCRESCSFKFCSPSRSLTTLKQQLLWLRKKLYQTDAFCLSTIISSNPKSRLDILSNTIIRLFLIVPMAHQLHVWSNSINKRDIPIALLIITAMLQYCNNKQ